VVTHAARTWLGARRDHAERDAELIDLVRVSVRDHFQRRKLVRQLEDLADQIAERTRPNYEHDFRNVAENERAAALLAVVDALKAADLTDDTLLAVDVDARNLARLVRERIPVRHPVRVAALGASAPRRESGWVSGNRHLQRGAYHPARRRRCERGYEK
jgi:hypothetical protein